MLNETSDVYSFGILIMEIISGRVPVDYNRPPGEVSNGGNSLDLLNNELEKCIYELCGAIFSD
jgi:serine/threonine protein kinase